MNGGIAVVRAIPTLAALTRHSCGMTVGDDADAPLLRDDGGVVAPAPLLRDDDGDGDPDARRAR
jgi:hypothetical protein